MCKSQKAPQVEDSILTSASETDSEAIVAFNFGGSTGVILILVMALVLSFFMYQFCRCCMPGRCRKQQRPTNDNQAVNNAIITLALAIGQQQHQSQQQQHQQVQEQQQQQLPRVTLGHNCSTVNQALLARLGKAAGTSGEVPGARQLQWRPEESEGQDRPGSGPGTNQEVVVPNGPPGVPEIAEQDLQQDPVLMQALWSIINNVH